MLSNERQRLADLLVDLAESLEVEVKAWIDPSDRSERARTARELIALANHGGGYLVFGYARQPDGSYVPATPRPKTLDHYNTDAINGIVARFAEPVFHCDTHFVTERTTGDTYPIVRVPGGHAVPIRAKREGPNGEIAQGAYYIRRPGPNSEPPQSGREWDELLRRCVQQQREALLDAFRAILAGDSPLSPAAPDELALLEDWTRESVQRWQEVTGRLPPGAPARFPHGHYRVTYLVLGDSEPMALTQWHRLLDASVTRYSGWPPFWVPSRAGLEPYAVGNVLECWIDPEHSRFPDAAHADFWRAAPDGRLFLMRGFQEDSGEYDVTAGTRMDVAVPIYRMGECLLHAARVAESLAGAEAEVMFQVHYAGLAGRALASLSGRRGMFTERAARADTFGNTVRVRVARIRDNLPEILLELLAAFYAQFGLFELSAGLVKSVVDEMRGNARDGRY